MFEGQPIEIRYRAGLRDTAGHPAHAASYLRQRLILLDQELRRDRREHERILTHEIFHFVWLRLGNPRRFQWETWLHGEWQARTRGEAGWSAEWRKQKLTDTDVTARSRAWRDYCCESFCDTAAWIQTGIETEVSLAPGRQQARRARFESLIGESQAIPI